MRIYVLSFLVLLLIAGSSSALILDEVAIDDVLADDGSVRESVSILMSNVTTSSFTLTLPQGAKGILVNGQPASEVNVSLDCTQCEVSVSYDLPKVVLDLGDDTFSFSRTLNLPSTPESFTYSMQLPIGTYLDLGGETPVVPLPSSILTDGRAISVLWSATRPELPTRYFIRYRGHESLETSITGVGEEQWGVWLIMVIILAAGMGAGFVIALWRENRKEVWPVVPASLLSPDEKKVLSAIGKGTLSQKEICSKLSWSKSKVSAVVSNLEYKSMIKREKVGRSYKVTAVRDYVEEG